MKINWIPRSKRWTSEERKQKETQARNDRALSSLLWQKLYSVRQEIEKEIEQKKLARIANLD